MSQAAPAPESQPIEQLQSLEDRIVSVVQLLKEMRAARQQAEQEAGSLRASLAEQQAKMVAIEEGHVSELGTRDSELASLREQLAAARTEREEVRRRLEKILHQIDSLSE